MKTSVFSTLYTGLFLIATSCSPLKNTKYDEYLIARYEVPTCDTHYNYTQTTTISGTAEYYKRGVNLVVQNSKLINMHLGNPLALPLPIRYAEVAVYDNASQVVQCGITDENGQLRALDGVSALEIPAQAGAYSVRVYSRINKILNFTGKADFNADIAVKKDIYTNELYYLSATAQSDGVDNSIVSLIAYARETESSEIIAGAFNILNAVYTGYDYIRTNTGLTNTTCLNERLDVYWKAGFNPFQYISPNADPSQLGSNSYYDNINKQLFITGGKLGNINLERTDHFGDYVIIHELGHHVENVCGSLLSPGGTHALISRIDPRVAWAEGWANYFSAKVLFDKIDTLDPEFQTKMRAAGFANTNWTYFFGSEGFSDSVQNIGDGSGFMFDLKKEGKNIDTWQSGTFFGLQFDAVDPNRYIGEGHFREGAITRGLFKLSTGCGTGGFCYDSVSSTLLVGFSDIWSSMDKLTGIGQSSNAFKSSHLLLENLKSNITSGTWVADYKVFNESASSEALHLFTDSAYSANVSGTIVNRWQPYGQALQSRVSGTCPSGVFYIEPRPDDPILTATNSDQRYSNHFYTIDLSQLAGLDEINVDFTKINTSGSNTEFDILLFKQDYFFNSDYGCSSTNSAGSCISFAATRGTTSDVLRSDRRTGLSLSRKTIRNLSSLSTSEKYILNIRAYTPNKSISTVTDYLYTIEDENGDTLCPDP